jgi:predicted membrane protein
MLPNDSLSNFLYPNTHIDWSLMIVIYPYITGLVAGSFVVSSLYHVFRFETFRPVARFALVLAFCFGLFAAVPLLFHIGQPQRAFNIFLTTHTTSAMSIFGYVYAGYMLLLILELWLTYRPVIIAKANASTGMAQRIWTGLALGITTYTSESDRVDCRVMTFLSAIGIPWACLLHGYVGFIFGTVKAVAWWATALQPIIFLLSAIVSGVAVVTVMYVFIHWRRGWAYDYQLIRRLMELLFGVFILDVTVELLEVVFTWYEQGPHWEVIRPLLAGPLFYTYVIGQLAVLSTLPLLLLGYVPISRISGRPLVHLVGVIAFLIALQVLFMRYNIVIGGQMISRSDRGFLSFEFEFFGREGELMSTLVFVAPFVTYFLISRFLPIFDEQGPIDAAKP